MNPMKVNRDICPCCGYPTIEPREHPLMPTFDICILCNWEDDGQGDKDADIVHGGPNGRYSLTEARNNFKKYLVMYTPDDDIRIGGGDYPGQFAVKKALINTFEEIKKSQKQTDTDELWQKVFDLENQLHDFIIQRIKQYEQEIVEKRRDLSHY